MQPFDDIKSGQIKPIYLFYGDEVWLMEEAIQALAQAVTPHGEDWSREVFDGSAASPGQVAAAALEGSLFGGARLVVARNITWLESGKKAAAEEKGGGAEETAPMIAYAADPNPATCLILTVRGSVDKRRKLVQVLQKTGRLVECATPKGGERDIWLSNRFQDAGFKADKRAIAYISVSAANLSQMAAEADKLMLYCADTGQITLSDAQALVAQSSLLTVFELTDAAAAQNAAQAVSCYRRLLRQGEEEQKIFALLAGQFRNMLLVQDLTAQGYRPADIASTLALHPFVVEKCGRAARSFNQRQLIKALEMLLAADIAQKSGKGEMEDLLETVILRICAM